MVLLRASCSAEESCASYTIQILTNRSLPSGQVYPTALLDLGCPKIPHVDRAKPHHPAGIHRNDRKLRNLCGLHARSAYSGPKMDLL
jgi:hypothetical protein